MELIPWPKKEISLIWLELAFSRTMNKGSLVFTEIIGFAYLRPQELQGVGMPQPDRYVMAILLVPGEAEFSQKFGTYRVLARLGQKRILFSQPTLVRTDYVIR